MRCYSVHVHVKDIIRVPLWHLCTFNRWPCHRSGG